MNAVLTAENQELHDKLKEREWRPISEAPKDGSRVLLWCEECNAPFSGQFYGITEWSYDYKIPPFKYQPTHFQPLPNKKEEI